MSFNRNTPLNQFIEIINPIVVRELGKRVVDPRNRSVPIGVPVSGMHYLDALEKVLEANGLTYRETETVFLVQEATASQQTREAASVDTTEEPPATVGTREIRINAMLFNLNLTKVRNRGLREDKEVVEDKEGRASNRGRFQSKLIICLRASTTSCRPPSKFSSPSFAGS